MTEAIAADVDALTPADFDYELPAHLIAQRPIPDRDASRLLVLERLTGTIRHSAVNQLASWLAPGDLLVANNSRVIPARLCGFREETGGAVEVLLLRQDDGVWNALARPAKRLRAEMRLVFPARTASDGAAIAVVVDSVGAGEIRLRFEGDADQRLDRYGRAPLPPYITEPLADEDRYQTVYATMPGSAAAPTAGLHFTHDLIDSVQRTGIEWAEITLHVGLDTFRPVNAPRISEHRIHREWCEVPPATAKAIATCRDRGGRVVAVGTTVARTLETLGCAWQRSAPHGWSGYTDLFILPGYRWQMVDALLTNFHLPRSTLLMLVSAFAGRDMILAAYAEAVREEYRFFSFGDAMLIL